MPLVVKEFSCLPLAGESWHTAELLVLTVTLLVSTRTVSSHFANFVRLAVVGAVHTRWVG